MLYPLPWYISEDSHGPGEGLPERGAAWGWEDWGWKEENRRKYSVRGWVGGGGRQNSDKGTMEKRPFWERVRRSRAQGPGQRICQP